MRGENGVNVRKGEGCLLRQTMGDPLPDVLVGVVEGRSVLVPPVDCLGKFKPL